MSAGIAGSTHQVEEESFHCFLRDFIDPAAPGGPVGTSNLNHPLPDSGWQCNPFLLNAACLQGAGDAWQLGLPSQLFATAPHGALAQQPTAQTAYTCSNDSSPLEQGRRSSQHRPSIQSRPSRTQAGLQVARPLTAVELPSGHLIEALQAAHASGSLPQTSHTTRPLNTHAFLDSSSIVAAGFAVGSSHAARLAPMGAFPPSAPSTACASLHKISAALTASPSGAVRTSIHGVTAAREALPPSAVCTSHYEVTAAPAASSPSAICAPNHGAIITAPAVPHPRGSGGSPTSSATCDDTPLTGVTGVTPITGHAKGGHKKISCVVVKPARLNYLARIKVEIVRLTGTLSAKQGAMRQLHQQQADLYLRYHILDKLCRLEDEHIEVLRHAQVSAAARGAAAASPADAAAAAASAMAAEATEAAFMVQAMPHGIPLLNSFDSLAPAQAYAAYQVSAKHFKELLQLADAQQGDGLVAAAQAAAAVRKLDAFYQEFEKGYTRFSLANADARKAVSRSGMLIQSAQKGSGADGFFAPSANHARVVAALCLTPEQQQAAAVLYEIIQVRIEAAQGECAAQAVRLQLTADGRDAGDATAIGGAMGGSSAVGAEDLVEGMARATLCTKHLGFLSGAYLRRHILTSVQVARMVVESLPYMPHYMQMLAYIAKARAQQQ